MEARRSTLWFEGDGVGGMGVMMEEVYGQVVEVQTLTGRVMLSLCWFLKMMC